MSLNSGVWRDISKLKRFAEQSADGATDITTSWILVTGAPGAGKTTLVNEMGVRGFHTNPDVSRAHIEELLSRGHTKLTARADERQLQEAILYKMIANAMFVPADEKVVWDYGLPDNVAFWRMAGLQPTSLLQRSISMFRYRVVALLEPLPLRVDHLRTEDAQYQRNMTEELGELYASLGYEPLWIPAAAVADRADTLIGAIA